MKPILVLFFGCGLALFARAASLYDQLCAFNPNWKGYAMYVPVEQARRIPDDKSYIQTHLQCVLTVLESRPDSYAGTAVAAARRQMIAWLKTYRSEGRFPLNCYRNERIPVFIDPFGTHCAVGYLMLRSGNGELAQRIAATNNYVWVKDLQVAGVAEWQQQCGLTVDELKLIQGAYDFYLENAFYLPNRFEVPQQPACVKAYFDESGSDRSAANLWCYGEGTDAVLNGRWIQNYAPGIPWIEGYFKDGQRTGNWKEYYQGTNLLCRTEQWKDNLLNGIRKRFDRQGKLIEQICFQNGTALYKVNYDLVKGLSYVRVPIDSAQVSTKVYNRYGQLIASGNERIHNPGNLLWFQNIELTALNTAAITARDTPQEIAVENGYFTARPFSHISNGSNGISGVKLYNQPPLVEYHKEGNWVYYREEQLQKTSGLKDENGFADHYPGLGNELQSQLGHFGKYLEKAVFDSVVVTYSTNLPDIIRAETPNAFLHATFDYPADTQNPLVFYNPHYRFRYADHVRMTVRPEKMVLLNESGKVRYIHHWKSNNQPSVYRPVRGKTSKDLFRRKVSGWPLQW